MAEAALRIALVGAECTGKTRLAGELRERLVAATGLPVATVPEWLRAWCDAAGRTPRIDEQRGIAEVQQAHIAAAARDHAIVICDTTALMTAVYSQQVFGDDSLLPWAADAHAASCDLTLLMAIDLPWQADGLQRDGAHVQVPVDDRIRAALLGRGLPFSVVAGRGGTRLQRAWSAVRPLLLARGIGLPEAPPGADGAVAGPAPVDSDTRRWAARRWRCECCLPEAERADRRQKAALDTPR